MLKRLGPAAVLAAVMWAVFALNQLAWHGDLLRFGIVPRESGGLPGILFAPFLHVSLDHIVANSVPLLVLGGVLSLRGKAEFFTVTIAGVVIGGLLTWALGRKAVHVGASGLVFCYFGYLASIAWFRRTLGSLALSVVCLLFYGGMVQGLLPSRAAVSWEAHVAGLVAGVIAASWTSGKTKPDPKP